MNGNIIKISHFPKGTPKDTVLSKTRTVLDNICRSCTVEEDITSGNYTLDAEFLVDSGGLWNELVEESILKAKLDYGTEIFVIKKVKKQSRYITVVAVQMTIHACNTLWLEDVRPTNTNGQGALSHILTNSIGKKKEIVLQSNISVINTAYYQSKRLQEALFSADNSFIGRWGGEVLRRGYTLSINDRIGMDRKVVIRRGKNLTGFEGTTDLDQLCTMAKGVGFDGITHEGYIMSPLADQYDQYYPREFKYDDVKVKTENDTEGYDTLEEAQAELIRRVNLEYTKNHVDELRAEYNLSFIPLSMTEEYKHLASETIYLGDTVKIQETLLGIDLKVRVISRKYDVMKQKPLSMTLSNIPIEEKRTTVSDSAIIKQLKDQIKQNNNSVAEYVQSMINSGSTNSYVLYRQNEILAMDSKDINSAINVVRLNKHGLGFSNTGYYGEYTYGFTIDGVLNASLIRTGILTAILIQSVSGDCSINLETGEVNFNKGSIKGPGIDISLNNGYVRTFATIAGEIFEVMLSQGGIKSNHSLSVKAQEKMNLESSGNWLYLLCQEGENGNKWSNILMSKDNVIVSADGGGSGKVLINGKNGVEINGREITSTLNNIETVMLRSEGII
ncbi:MAG: phage tail spike protein [Clostridium sp.]|uniref:phage tail spike protein n=1 Tax=Clostridium sp. TaxID=1506 RepID=UPI0029141A2E|nr:phage tail spike protein [Clostridium sp.]MDU4319743.1 phage tail spike protein [Clostridium sp.]